MIFDDIIGNEKNKEFLKKIIDTKKIAHSYIFTGESGIGKMLFAKNFAKAIMCLEEKESCICKSCAELDNNNNPDFQIIEPIENTIKVDQIRELTKKIIEKPIVSRRKVYIINNSELMTEQAQNGLLKTLEEPPEYATIILITSKESSFLPTIKSRCIIIPFEALTDEELKNVLSKNGENIDYPKEMFELFSGSVEKALKLKDKKDIYLQIEKMFNNLENINILDLIKFKEEYLKDKEEIINILEYINILFFKKYKKNVSYIRSIELVEETKKRLKANSNYDMTLDNFIFAIWEEING